MSRDELSPWPSALDIFGVNDVDHLPALVDIDVFGIDETLTPAERRRIKWERFHEANPRVYELLRELALALVRRGRTHLSIRQLWETMRCMYNFATTDSDYKLNDHYTAFYSRLLMEREAELRGVFELRERSR